MKPIEESLLGLEGIEQAHVRLSDDGPTGVRVVLASSADRVQVARAIKELFTTRGLTVAVDDGESGSVTSVGQPLVEGPVFGSNGSPSSPGAEAVEIPSPERPVAEPEPAPPARSERVRAQRESPLTVSPADLAVAVSEGPTYCDVAVRIGPDRRSVRRSNPDPVSIREAILDALNDASGRSGLRPTVVSVDLQSVSQKTMITVVLESAGQLGVGSALVRGTEFHAFGIAAMAALRYLPSF